MAMRKLADFESITMTDIKDEYGPDIGRHWFDRDTIRFFKSRLPKLAYLTDDKRRAYFVTAECGPSGNQAYSVRVFDRDIRDIDTQGEFNKMTRGEAHSYMRRILNDEPQKRRFMAQARQLPDDEIRRHAWVATASGPFDPSDESFTTCCELVRREKGLPPLHNGESE